METKIVERGPNAACVADVTLGECPFDGIGRAPDGEMGFAGTTRCFLNDSTTKVWQVLDACKFAQNVSGTWTAAGYLHGKARKTRAVVQPRPESVTLLLFLGYLEGRTGQRLFSSDWTNLLGCSPDELEALATSASHRGLMVFMNAGGVQEVRFPGYLTPEEERIRQEVSHVV